MADLRLPVQRGSDGGEPGSAVILSDATTTASGAMSAADKAKIDSLSNVSFSAFSAAGGNASAGPINLSVSAASIDFGNAPKVGDKVMSVIQAGNTVYSVGPNSTFQFGDTIGGTPGNETIKQWSGDFRGLEFNITTYR